MKSIRVQSQILAILIMLILFLNWRNASIGFELAFHQTTFTIHSTLFIGMSALFFTLNLFAAASLYFSKKNRFILTSFAILFSTLFFGTCYLPFIEFFMPLGYKISVLIISNIIVMLYLMVLQIQARRA